MNNKQRIAWTDLRRGVLCHVRLSSMLYLNDFGEQVEKRFWFAFSDLILVFQFDCLVFGNEKKKDFVLSWAQSGCCVSPPVPDRSSCTAQRSLLSYFPEDKGQVWNMNNSIHFVQRSIHQGSETFSEPSRGRQCAFITLSALFHNESVSVHSWTKSVIDQILWHHGDGMYSHTLCRWWQILSIHFVNWKNRLHCTVMSPAVSEQ